MATRISPPSSFSFKPKDWPAWIQRFGRYRRAVKLDLDDQERQVDALLYAMGEQSENVFESLTFHGEEEKDYKIVVQRLTEHFIPKRNVIYERSRFHLAAQNNRSVEEFERELHELAKYCDFKDKEDQIRDRFVLGLTDQQVQSKLHLESDLTLARAVELAKQYEQVKCEMSSKATDEVYKPKRFTHNQSGSSRAMSNGRNYSYSKQQQQLPSKQKQHAEGKCGKCGFTHDRHRCPASGKECRNCNKKGHFAKMCFKRVVREVQCENEDHYWIDTIISDDKKPWVKKLMIQGSQVDFKIDTGADISIMNEQTFYSLKVTPKIYHTSVALMSPGGKVVSTGEFTATTTVKGLTYSFTVVLVKNRGGNNLLSRNVAEEMQLVKRLEEADVYGTTGLLKTKPVKIELKDNAVPYSVTTARRVPFPLLEKVEGELKRMESAGVIKSITEPTDWCAPMVPVLKKSGKVRICVDFKQLNQSVKRPYLMLPNLEDIAPKLAGATVFSTLDASSGFWQVPIEVSSMPLTTFITPVGRYCFCRIPMGINFGPEEFQAQMTKMLKGLEGCDVIMDDILVWGTDEKEHDERLNSVLKTIEKSGLKLNKDKCQLKRSQVKYFGHTVSASGIQPNADKVAAILDMPAPKNVTELRTVCGMMNYLTRFAPNLAATLKPVTDLLKLSNVWNWGPPQQAAFDQAKKVIKDLPSLRYYRLEREVIVSADASSYGLGAVLLQREESGSLVPIAFASRTLTDAECRYAQIEKECLASVWACEKFCKYLVGLPEFELWTDHKPLVPLMTSKDLDKAPVRCQRLLMRHLRFNSKVTHKPGKQLVIADALSRSPVAHTMKEVERESEVQEYVDAVQACWPVSSTRLDVIRQAAVHDADIQQVMDYVLNGWPNPHAVPSHLRDYYMVRNSLSIIGGLLVYEQRIAIPQSQRGDIIGRLHESHQGVAKCRDNAQRSVWWPGISADIKQLIENCRQCQENRPAQRAEPLRPSALPGRPWEKVGADLCSVDGKQFLVIVDYYSRWIELERLMSTTATAVINKFRHVFATHGIPDEVHTDNGPQFQCHEFRSFAQNYGFKFTTSSPYLAQANGEAESGVKIAKKIIAQASPDIALLNYRSTPHSTTGVSPSVALMGRELKTRVPTLPSQLMPKRPCDSTIRQSDSRAKTAYKKQFDCRHGARPLPYLQRGDPVLIRKQDKWKTEGTVVAADQENRTYLVDTDGEIKRRNRKHLLKLTSADVVPSDGDAQTVPSPNESVTSSAQAAPLPDGDVPPNAPTVTAIMHTPRATRASHGISTKKPIRFREDI